jgi:CDP-diacylglycerol--glycerol-3-phosphate 3-phosphatidyltransferase
MWKDVSMFRKVSHSVGSFRQAMNNPSADLAHQWMEIVFTPLVRLLDRMNISPNAITVVGTLFGVGGGALLALGRWKIAAALIVFSGFLDGVDGLLARQSHKVSPLGAFLDSVLDRWSDTAFYLGLLIWYLNAGMRGLVILVTCALASSLLVSYTRARAEGIGARCGRGVFTRLERFIVLIAGLLLNLMPLALWVIVILSTFTAIQRIVSTIQYAQTHLNRKNESL